ncbi:AbrB family transcriptional regulator [Sphingobium sp. H39-3-25]|uniref:AbrB family transcriptional regulator n=1 Tax=Sphingobium arseniciresistens TaxID=3030834 RepID=UPI0023BA2899|nr:AbrB family transcriptional regulator [Sphingobium arseniciresistens]
MTDRAAAVAASQHGAGRLGPWQWPVLMVLSAMLFALFAAVRLTSAAFLGPMVAGLAMALAGSDLRIARQVPMVCQAVIGCMVGLGVNFGTLSFVGAHGPVIAGVIGATALATCAVAWCVARASTLSAQTAAWGAMPGAANIMVALAAESGGDARLVAFMQYIRVIAVLSTASVVASIMAGPGPATSTVAVGGAAGMDVPLNAGALAASAVLIMAGLLIGRGLRIPAGPLLVTAMLASGVHGLQLFPMQLPGWALSLAFSAVGWFVGLQFDRAALGMAVRNLPAMICGTLALIVLCAGIGMVLSLRLGLDPVTGYLATSPGAIDTVAILASGGKADMAVVMAIQTLRFFAVIMLAPWLAAFIARIVPARRP